METNIKFTEKGKYILAHGAPEGFITESPFFTEGKKTFLKYDEFHIEPKGQHPFRYLEMSFWWQGHELITQKINEYSIDKEQVNGFTITGIIGYVEVNSI